MKKAIHLFVVGLLFLFVACSSNINESGIVNETIISGIANETITVSSESDGTADEAIAMDVSDYPPISWQTITATEALTMIAELDNFILLDVRTVAEYQEIRIEGAVLIPYDVIKDKAETELPDKNTVILVYCRSGRRSALAAADLVALGFTHIYDFGGIINWPFETISG